MKDLKWRLQSSTPDAKREKRKTKMTNDALKSIINKATRQFLIDEYHFGFEGLPGSRVTRFISYITFYYLKNQRASSTSFFRKVHHRIAVPKLGYSDICRAVTSIEHDTERRLAIWCLTPKKLHGIIPELDNFEPHWLPGGKMGESVRNVFRNYVDGLKLIESFTSIASGDWMVDYAGGLRRSDMQIKGVDYFYNPYDWSRATLVDSYKAKKKAHFPNAKSRYDAKQFTIPYSAVSKEKSNIELINPGTLYYDVLASEKIKDILLEFGGVTSVGDTAPNATVRDDAAAGEDGMSPGVRLLHDIRDVMGNRADLKSSALVDALIAMEDAPWGEWRRGLAITTRGVAQLLKPFGVVPYRGKGGSVYRAEDMGDVWSRYLDTTPLKVDAGSEKVGQGNCPAWIVGTYGANGEELVRFEGLRHALHFLKDAVASGISQDDFRLFKAVEVKFEASLEVKIKAYDPDEWALPDTAGVFGHVVEPGGGAPGRETK
jgi:hypothetical protein